MTSRLSFAARRQANDYVHVMQVELLSWANEPATER